MIRTTGSDELPPILFEDGAQAATKYNIPRYSGGPCPHCKFPVDQTLQFNPLDSKYYFTCPLCLRTYRWAETDGRLSDLKQVKVSKTTGLDIDEDFPQSEGFR
jgi:hypothetical protein